MAKHSGCAIATFSPLVQYQPFDDRLIDVEFAFGHWNRSDPGFFGGVDRFLIASYPTGRVIWLPVHQLENGEDVMYREDAEKFLEVYKVPTGGLVSSGELPRCGGEGSCVDQPTVTVGSFTETLLIAIRHRDQ